MHRGFLQMFPDMSVNGVGGTNPTKLPEKSESTDGQNKEKISIFSEYDDNHATSADTSEINNQDKNFKSIIDNQKSNLSGRPSDMSVGVFNILKSNNSTKADLWSNLAEKINISYDTGKADKTDSAAISAEQSRINNKTKGLVKSAISSINIDAEYQKALDSAKEQYNKPLEAVESEFPGGTYTGNPNGSGVYEIPGKVKVTFDNNGRETSREVHKSNGNTDFTNTEFLRNGTVCTTSYTQEPQITEDGLKMPYGPDERITSKGTRTFSVIGDNGLPTRSLTFKGQNNFVPNLSEGSGVNTFYGLRNNVVERTYEYTSPTERTVTEKLGKITNPNISIDNQFNVKDTQLDVVYSENLHSKTYTERLNPKTNKWEK